MFGIGAAIRFVRKMYQGGAKVEQVDAAIAKLEKECAAPVLSPFRGRERFDAAVRLHDATLLRRVQQKPDATTRLTLIDAYVESTVKEYEMAKADLTSTPATRADVVALGLALKQIALSLDEEISVFRTKGAVLMAEEQATLTGTTQLARQKIEEAIVRLATELREASQRVEQELHASLDSSFASQSREMAVRLARSEAEHVRKLEALAGEHRELSAIALREGLEQHNAMLSARLAGARDEQRQELAADREVAARAQSEQDERVSRTLEAFQTEQVAAHGEMRRRLDVADARQSTFLAAVHREVVIQRWVLAAAAVAVALRLFF
jgi:hypothetical protein